MNKAKAKKAAKKAVKPELTSSQKFERAIEDYVNHNGIYADENVEWRCIQNDFMYEDLLAVLKTTVDARIAEFRLSQSMRDQLEEDTAHTVKQALKR